MKELIGWIALLCLSACASKPTVASTTGTSAEPLAAGPQKSISKISCSQTQDTRSLEVIARAAGGCDLLYTKFGAEKSVAQGEAGTDYCTEVRDRIKTNLKQAGFTCE